MNPAETPGRAARDPHEAAERAWEATGDWEMAVEAALAAQRMLTAAQERPAPAAGQYVIFRKTGPGCCPTAHGPYSEAEAGRLGEPRGDNESRLKLLLGRDLEEA